MTETLGPPKIENAPGLIWKVRMVGWEARWQARTDLVRRGFTPSSLQLWKGSWPNDAECAWIAERCQTMQDEMLLFGRGGEVATEAWTGNMRSLISAYETDPDSSYKKLRYRTRESYGSLTRRIMRDMGEMPIEAVKARDLLRVHEKWVGDGHIPMAHSLVGMLRTLFTFGATILDNEECRRVKNILSDMKFKMGQPRKEALTATQADAVRAMAHKMGLHSIALAQAFQYDCTLRQKDVIGEWIPLTEPGVSDVISGNEKWLRGIRTEEIDANLVLRHITSKRNKLVTVPLIEAPMVMEEIRYLGQLPTRGPLVISELTRQPWTSYEFRRQWRKVARACKIPDEVYNMDSRAGAITEGLEATDGDLDTVRIGATHSNAATTQRYSRGEEKRIGGLMRKRAAHRNGPRTSGTGTDGE